MADVVGKRISDLANNASIDGTAIFPHTQNGSTMRVSLSNITDYILAQVDEDTVKDAVNEWMNDHPDVTTTVQDGAISTVKLANDAVTSEKIKNGTIAGIDLSIDLLNAICASGSASGSVATFHDGAYGLPLKSCIVSVNLAQSGSGDPSPTNIRPITGWTGANITRTGKNMLGGMDLANAVKESMPSATITDEYVQFAASATVVQSIVHGIFKENTRYTLLFTYAKNDGNTAANMRVYYTDGTFADLPRHAEGITPVMHLFVTAANKTVSNIRKSNNSGTTNLYYNECGIFEGVLTEDDFVPYEGNTYLINWEDEAGTVYGGTLDVINGTLTKEYESVDLADLTWRLRTGSRFSSTLPSSANVLADISEYIGSCLPIEYAVGYGGVTDGHIGIYKTAASTQTDTIYLNLSTIGITDVTTLSEWLTTNNVQLVYPLATPIEYDLTPTEITTLIGENNILADCGDISVEYFANTQTYIEQRINATKSMIAGVEADYVATQNYTSGSLLIVGDTLYITTAAIASGAALTPGTNMDATTVAANLGGSLPSAQGVSF